MDVRQTALILIAGLWALPAPGMSCSGLPGGILSRPTSDLWGPKRPLVSGAFDATPLATPPRLPELLFAQFGGGRFGQPQGGAQPAAASGLVGTWAYQDANVKVLLILSANGRYSLSLQQGQQSTQQTGDYKIAADGMEMKADGAGLTGVVPYKLLDADTLQVTTPDGITLKLSRQTSAQQTPAVEGIQKSLRSLAQLKLPAGRVLQKDLKAPLPLPAAAGGHIVFSRAIQMSSGIREVPEPISLTKLYVVNADGSGLAPFLAPEGFVNFRQVAWSPRYDRLAFVSDYRNFASACYEDIFVANADGSGIFRITGNELREPGKSGWAKLRGTVLTRIVSQVGGGSSFDPELPKEAIHVAAQGCDGVYTPSSRGVHTPANQPKQGNAGGVRFASWQLAQSGTMDEGGSISYYTFEIPRVAVGDIWIKVWAGKHAGALYFGRTEANASNFIPTILPINTGSFFCHGPSLSNDGTYIVGVSSVAWTEMQRNPPAFPGEDPPLRVEGKAIDGADDIAVFSAENGLPLAQYQMTKAQGQSAKDPAVSPDGKWIAAGCGQFGKENLSLISVDELLGNKGVQPRALVQGTSQFEGAIVTLYGHGSPAWSADGRQIAFIRGAMRGDGSLFSNLCVIGADGSGTRQLTALDATHGKICTDPCFSPDGSRIAFTVLSSRFGVIKLEQLATMQNLTSDIYTIRTDGSDLRKLTNDGVSFDPAWGP